MRRVTFTYFPHPLLKRTTVGDLARLLDILQRIAPSIIDRLFRRVSFIAQLTGDPKQADAPDNLFAPIEGYDTVEGDFGNLSVPSFTDWLNRNPPIKWGRSPSLLPVD